MSGGQWPAAAVVVQLSSASDDGELTTAARYLRQLIAFAAFNQSVKTEETH